MDTDDGHGMTSSSEDDSSMEDETIHIELTNELREFLESDYYLIKDKNKVSLQNVSPSLFNCDNNRSTPWSINYHFSDFRRFSIRL